MAVQESANSFYARCMAGPWAQRPLNGLGRYYATDLKQSFIHSSHHYYLEEGVTIPLEEKYKAPSKVPEEIIPPHRILNRPKFDCVQFVYIDNAGFFLGKHLAEIAPGRYFPPEVIRHIIEAQLMSKSDFNLERKVRWTNYWFFRKDPEYIEIPYPEKLKRVSFEDFNEEHYRDFLRGFAKRYSGNGTSWEEMVSQKPDLKTRADWEYYKRYLEPIVVNGS